MGLTAIIGDALTDHSAHPFGLYLDGLDVIKEHATPSRFAVPIDSIDVTEAGPGGISSMRFSIDDPLLVLSFSYSARVEYWDLTNNWPIFAGYIQAPTIVSDFGQQGRTFVIEAVGIEAGLDSIIVDSLTINPTGSASSDGVGWTDQRMIQAIMAFGPFRAEGLDLTSTTSTQALPTTFSTINSNAPAFVMDGLSLRSAWEACGPLLSFFFPPFTYYMTVDFYGGVRLFPWASGLWPTHGASDYATITIDNSPGGVLASSNLSYQIDNSPGTSVTAVKVKGATAAGSGWATGDTRYGRLERYIQATSTNAADMANAGNAVLSQSQPGGGRGSLTLLDFTPVNAHPGSQLIVTDARQGFVAKLFTITEIHKTFKSNGKQDWDISFTDPSSGPNAGPASAMRLARTLTRGTN